MEPQEECIGSLYSEYFSWGAFKDKEIQPREIFMEPFGEEHEKQGVGDEYGLSWLLHSLLPFGKI